MTDPSTQPGERMDLHDELTLAALPSAVNQARLLVELILTRWAFDKAFIRRVEAVADELVVHAVATTGVTDDEPLYAAAFDNLDVIVVRLRTFAGRVVIEVWDRTEAAPLELLAESAAVADAEHWDFAVPLPGRRVVWCVMSPACAAGDTRERSLPQRVPAPTRPGGDKPLATPVDTAVLLRVLDGLRRAP
jgi:anti-sigma regulatory factor (Ser/Thr protein kinase)